MLTVNPLPALRKATPRSTQIPVVDRRAVANPVQARTLLRAVGDDMPSGPRLVAFFGCLYFAALRPEEAAAARPGAPSKLRGHFGGNGRSAPSSAGDGRTDDKGPAARFAQVTGPLPVVFML
jgi:hypothetical protein